MTSSFFLSRPYASAAAVGSLTMRLTSSPAMRVLRGLPLSVVEIGRYRDDRVGHLLAEIVLRRLLEFHQDMGAHLGRTRIFSPHDEGAIAVVRANDLVRDALQLFLHLFKAPADEALGAEDGVLGVGHCLSLGDLADQHVRLVVPSDHARRRACPLLVDDHLGLAPLHDRHDAIGRAEVDANDLAHGRLPPNLLISAGELQPRPALFAARHGC
jgi:hypothetical protein